MLKTRVYLGLCWALVWASLVAQLVKNLPAMQETWVQLLGWEDPLEKGKATHSSILAWRILWTIHRVAKSRTRLSDFYTLFPLCWKVEELEGQLALPAADAEWAQADSCLRFPDGPPLSKGAQYESAKPSFSESHH